MPDDGDDRLSSDDLIRKAKEQFDGVKEDVPPTEGPLEARADEDESRSDAVAGETATVRETAAGQSGDRLNGEEEPVSTEPLTPFPTEQPPPASEQRDGRGGVGALLRRFPIWLVIIGVFTLGGFVYNFFTEAKRDDTGAVVQAGEVAADDLHVGDCLLLPENVSPDVELFSFEFLDAVQCSAPHDMEVFAVSAHPAGPYPGETALFEWAAEMCRPAFEAFTGVSFDYEARFDFIMTTPDSAAWSDGKRTVECMLTNLDGTTLVGSQEGGGVLLIQGLQVSDCYDISVTATYFGFTEVNCDVAHDIEYYALSTLPHDEGATFPGDAFVNNLSEDECEREFESYVGRQWELSATPAFQWFYPNAETWSFGSRSVRCFLADPNRNKLTGSYRSDEGG